MSERTLQIALVGNPNSGKSSLFNTLTGLNQKVGNFPGVTVDKKAGSWQITPDLNAEVIDLLARRLELSERIGEVKKACNMTAYQPDRWREIVATRGERADKLSLSKDFILALYQIIHDESIRKQLGVLHSMKNPAKG